MPQISVQVNLIVKANGTDQALQHVERRLTEVLNAWFVEGHDFVPEHAGGPGYPHGSLLLWSVSSQSKPSLTPAPSAGPPAPGENATRAVSGPANPLPARPARPAAPAPAPQGWTEV